MRPLLASAASLLVILAAGVAAADGFQSGTRIRWNACYGDGGAINRDFACNTNTGSEQLVCTFTLSAPVDSVYQMDAIVRLAFAGGAVPPWWMFRTAGACRGTSLGASTAAPATASACIDWAEGRDALLTYQPNSFAPYLSQIEVLTPFIGYAPYDLVAGQEYFVFSAIINHQKTVGTGSCAGCTLGGCMGFVAARLFRSATGTYMPVPEPSGDVLVGPIPGDGQAAMWQGGAGIAIPNYGGAGYTYCPGATPARNRTWGDVKALYR